MSKERETVRAGQIDRETAVVDPEPTADAVALYLRQHPDFFLERPDLLRNMALPQRWSGDSVVDLQHYQVQTLRDELDGLRDCAQEVIETSRVNMATQARTHAAVVALLSAADLSHLLQVVGDDLPVLLDVDAATIALEMTETLGVVVAGIGRLREGDVNRLVGTGQQLALYREFCDDGTVFGAAAGLVSSASFVRMQPGGALPDGVLALGSRSAGTFHPGQGTELLRFLAQIVEICLRRLLPIQS